MGVKGLWNLLQPVARPVKLEMLSGKRVAIDSSIWLYHFLRAIKDKQGHTLTNAHILGFLRRILKILFYGMKPVFVFDGGAPKMKKTTIFERKNRRQGARQSHAQIASKLLSAQLRKKAIQHQQSVQSSKKSKPNKEDNTNDNNDNIAYLEDLEPKSSNKSTKSPDDSKNLKKPKRLSDPYELPSLPFQPKSSTADPRLATENELRDFITSMKPSDFDTQSPAFKQLPFEVQYEIIGDLRLKSRSTSFSRLEKMLRTSSTAIDFSKAQIQNLMQRNDLTQKLITHSEGGGNDETPVALRVSTSRNKEYFLMRQPENVGGGWVLGIQDTRGEKGQKPIELNSDDDENDMKKSNNDDEKIYSTISTDEDEDDFEMEEVEIPSKVIDKSEQNYLNHLQDHLNSNVDEADIEGVVYDDFVEDEVQKSGLDELLKTRDVIENENDENNVKYINNPQNKVGLSKMKASDLFNVTPKSPQNEPTKDLPKVNERPRLNENIPNVNEKSKIDDNQKEKEDIPLFLDEDEYEEDSLNDYESNQFNENILRSDNDVTGTVNLNEIKDDINKRDVENVNINVDVNKDEIEKLNEAKNNNNEIEDNESAYSGWSESPPPPQTLQERMQVEKETERLVKESEEQIKQKARDWSPPIDIDASDNEKEVNENIESEEKDYLKFTSNLRNKNYDEMIQEVDSDIRKLEQSSKKMSGGSDDPTMEMTNEIKRMLKAFGIPYITAPMEAEAQCAKLAEMNLVDGIITDDSDVFLFGGTIVYKNMFNDKQFVECYVLTDIERDLSLNRDRLIELAHILGSDYTNGLAGVGPVMAMELIADFSKDTSTNTLDNFKQWWLKVQSGKDDDKDTSTRFRKLFKNKFKNLTLESDWPHNQVRNAYYNANVNDDDQAFEWGLPNLEELREYLNYYLGWSISKVDDTIVPVMKHMRMKKAPPQTSLDMYFDNTAGAGVLGERPRAQYASSRLKDVVKSFRDKSRSNLQDTDGNGETSTQKTRKRKTTTKSNRKKRRVKNDESSYESD